MNSTEWIGTCPTCEAEDGQPCVVIEGPLRGEPYDEPHAAREVFE